MIQITKHTPNIFYVYDQDGGKVGTEHRDIVHQDGSWHRGVQLNLCHHDYLLMQRRSNTVDIAKDLLDQSLATQLITSDNEEDLLALRRGLMEELGIDIDDLDIQHLAGPVKIIKKYQYDPKLINCEFVSLYQAQIPRIEINPRNPKIKSLFWMPIREVKQIAKKHPDLFTQTFLMWLKEAM